MNYTKIRYIACYPNLAEGSAIKILVRPTGTTGTILEDVDLRCFEISGEIGGELNISALGRIGNFNSDWLKTYKTIKINEGWKFITEDAFIELHPNVYEEIEKLFVIVKLKYV